MDNGPLAQEYLHPKNRPHVLKLYSFDTVEEELEFSLLLGRIYVILCILNSRDTVKIDDFRAYCLQTHIRWNKLFPWFKDNETFHAVLGKVII